MVILKKSYKLLHSLLIVLLLFLGCSNKKLSVNYQADERRKIALYNLSKKDSLVSNFNKLANDVRLLLIEEQFFKELNLIYLGELDVLSAPLMIEEVVKETNISNASLTGYAGRSYEPEELCFDLMRWAEYYNVQVDFGNCN